MINFDFLFDSKKEDYQAILDDARSGKGQLVDIREKQEWEQAHFKCATHLPLSELSKGIGIDKLRSIKQSGKKIYLHCQSGGRARMAEKILAQYGCSEFTVIPISMLQMIDKGFQIQEQAS